eukprot:5338863-Amphidinium_carterae.1
MWDSGASHFLLPRQLLPRNAKDTKEASIRLAIGERDAVYWRDEVYSVCCNMVLVPAGKVTRVLELFALQSPKNLTLWVKKGQEDYELLMTLTKSGDMAYLTRRQTDILRRAMWEKQRDASLNVQSGDWWGKLHLQIKSACFGDPEIKNQEIPELKFAITSEVEECSAALMSAPQIKKTKRVDPASMDIIAKILDSLDDTTIKKAHSRTNILPDETSDREVPRPVLLGAYTQRGSGITVATERLGWILPLIHNLAHMPGGPVENGFEYTAVQLTSCVTMETHRDGNNMGIMGPSWTIGFGSFQGGELWVETKNGPEGALMVRSLRKDKKSRERGSQPRTGLGRSGRSRISGNTLRRFHGSANKQQAKPMELEKVPGVEEVKPEENKLEKDNEGVYPDDCENLKVLEGIKPGLIVDAVMPMTGAEWEQHCRDGHLPKRADCPICQVGSGPPVRHYTQETLMEKFGTLHVDLTGPLDLSEDKNLYILTAVHMVEAPSGESVLVPWAIPIKDKTGKIVAGELARIVDYVPTMSALKGYRGLQIARLHSDNGGEFINEDVAKVMQARQIVMTQAPPYMPCSNGLVERYNGIIKDLMRRQLDNSPTQAYQSLFWSWSARYAAEVLKTAATSRVWDQPAFGEWVVVNRLQSSTRRKALDDRGLMGRFLHIRM